MHLAVRTIDFDYPLPEELIADRPLPDRSASRMMVIHRDTGMIEHRHFCDLPEYVREGDHFILNDTRVVPARYFSNDGSIEIVRAEVLNPLLWKCMVRPGRKMKLGRTVAIGEAVGIVEDIDGEGYRLIRFDREVDEEKYGRLALPHYMNRESDPSDKERYQTVYARHEGAIAAPTAGLHFTPEVIGRLRAEGHPTAEVTLHVGAGTFLPVKAGNAAEHPMHTEHFEITLDALQGILEHIDRITAVGTTSMRTLESLAALGCRVLLDGTPDERRSVGQWEIYDMPERIGGRESLEALAGYMGHARLQKLKASTQIMIVPGYRFRVASSLITNFHQPQSTLLLLVSAFIGERWKEVYDYALAHDFRFLSYGDSSLLFRQNGQ